MPAADGGAAAGGAEAAAAGEPLFGDSKEEDADRYVRNVLAQLSTEEKVGLLSGSGMWRNNGVARMDIKPLGMTDGPHGARGMSLRGDAGALLAPCETALAATFDVDCVEQVGEVLGLECRRRGADILLGPTLNLQRFPNTGRHFECFSEDPYLSARLGVAYVRGVQKHAVACVKHFVCNDQETDRGTQNSVVDWRTLREEYLAPFEATIVEGGAGAVMCGYNRVNGSYCTENRELLTEVLRKEWGFKGLVMSDWFGNQSTEAAIEAGLNLEMPGIEPLHYGGYLVEAVNDGTVSMERLDERCRPVLRAMLRAGREIVPPPPSERDTGILANAAAQACVLLRNERSTLPLDAVALRRIAVIGPNAAQTVLQGGGSSRVHPRRSASMLDAIRAAVAENAEVEVVHAQGCHWEQLPRSAHTLELNGLFQMGGCDASGQPAPASLNGISAIVSDTALTIGASIVRLELFRRRCMPVFRTLGWRTTTPAEAAALAASRAAKPRPPPAEPTGQWGDDVLLGAAEKVAVWADVTVLVLGTHGFWELEGTDQPHERLLGRQDELVTRVAAAAKGPVIVVLNVGSPKVLPWLDKVDAVVLAHFGGQEMASGVTSVLFGHTNPSGRLPTTWPHRLCDVAAKVAERQRTTEPKPGDVMYDEGLRTGYRGVSDATPPLFYFGFGLSYTRFSYGPMKVRQSRLCDEAGGPCAIVRVVVKNEGERPGAEVVQLYVEVAEGEEEAIAGPRALRAFRRTKKLESGASEDVALELDPRGLGAWYDAATKAWRCPKKGWRVRLSLGASAAKSEVHAEVELVLQ